MNTQIGKQVTLQPLTAVKMYSEANGRFIVTGYVYDRKNKPIDVEVESYINGITIIGTDGCLYPLKPEHDCDFYAVVHN